MEWWDALLKGVIQGLTEFLPVSSTAHLILYDTLLEQLGIRATALSPTQEEVFDILLHIGTLGAVLLYYRKQWGQLLQSALLMLSKPKAASAALIEGHAGLQWQARPLLTALLIAFFTTSIVALVVIKLSALWFDTPAYHAEGVHDISEFYLARPVWVLVHLAVTGLLLWFAESRSVHNRFGIVASSQLQEPFEQASTDATEKEPVKVTPIQGLTVGLFQCGAAIFHGISRSGSTITGGMLAGLSRQQAAHFTFMLSAPIFMAVALYALLKVSSLPASFWASLDWNSMAIGMLAAFVVGYLCVKGFVRFVGRYSLRGFAIYCWTLSALMALSGLIH